MLARQVNRFDDPTVRHAMTPLVFELRRLKLPAYEELECALLRQTDPSILSAGADLYHVIGDWAAESAVLQRLLEREQDELAAAAARVRYARLLVLRNDAWQAAATLEDVARTAKAHQDHLLLLDALLEQTYAHAHTADCHRGRRAATGALSLLEQVRPRFSDEAYRAKQLVAAHVTGCVEHNADANAAGVASHGAALALARELDDGLQEALALINLADAQWGCWRYAEALRTYQQARAVSAAECYIEGSEVAQLGQGIVLWSVGRYAEAAEALESGLGLARELGDVWATAYGLAYCSNVQATRGDLVAALRTSHEAITLAQDVGAGYLLALATFHHLWQQEALAPGQPDHTPLIEEAFRQAQTLGLDGLALHLGWVRLLHRAADPAVPDSALARELEGQVGIFRAHAPVKGAWELLGAQVVGAVRACRPAVDVVDLEALVEDVCRTKATSLDPADQEVYRATRHCWNAR